MTALIPWRPDSSWRERALEWCTDRLPCEYRLALGSDPWSKGRALWSELRRWDAGDVIVVHDADVWCHGLQEAIEVVKRGRAAWAVPHGRVWRLSDRGTENLYAGVHWRQCERTQEPYQGVMGGGIVVVRREVMLDCPIDPRFVGWSGEDEAWAMALWYLHGKPWRGDSPLVHCWHPPQPRLTRRIGSQENLALRERYVRARGSRQAMLAMQAEVHDALAA